MNKWLQLAKQMKNDEFYTKYEDIEKELKNYTSQLQNKKIYCNCDDIAFSKFYTFFKNNIIDYNIKEVYFSHYNNELNFISTSIVTKLENINGQLKETQFEINGNGDFRNKDNIRLLKKCDIVITNPPFSLLREFIPLIIENKKDLILITPINNIVGYKNIFPYFKNNILKVGYNIIDSFYGIDKKVFCYWVTTLNVKEKPFLKLEKEYDENYKKIQSINDGTIYDIINVNKTKDIPKDYYGEMAVPVSFIIKYNKNQFELLKLTGVSEEPPLFLPKVKEINSDKILYKRLCIKIKEGNNE